MNLNYLSPINSLGYGVTALNILKELCKKDVNVALHHIGQIDCSKDDGPLVQKCLNNAVEYDNNATCLKVFHPHAMKEFIGKGEKIGFPIFELDTFSLIEKHQLNNLDKLFVTSDWAKKVCEDNGIKVPIYTIPLGVDRNVFNDFSHYTNDINKDSATKFLICGKWELRKGHDAVIEAFCRAFTPQDNVRLICNCFNPFIGKEGNKQWNQMYLLSNMSNKIHIITERIPTQTGVAELMSSVDCGVFVSRAEGWNLELLEMMSCGKNVIATNATAHTAFVNKDNCHLVEVGPYEVAYDGVFFHGTAKWPSLTENSINQIVEHMKNVHSLKQNGFLKQNISGIETAIQFSWQNCANKIMNAL